MLQDERDLAAIDGMNVFAAAVILCSISLDDFLDKTPEERVEEFGDLIGRSRVVSRVYPFSCYIF